MVLKEITKKIESVVPLRWQEEWDNSGLQIGDGDTDINAVLLSVDVTETTIREAVGKGCNLIVSHHPLFFYGVKHLTGSTAQERCITEAIKNGIAVYSLHTPVDCYLHGVSGLMAQKCGIKDYRQLDNGSENKEYGLGVIGDLPEKTDFNDFIRRLKQSFHAPYIRYVRPPQTLVQTIAFCGGAGSSLLECAVRNGAQVLVSADFKYHEMQSAEGRIGIADMDHWVSEQAVRELIQSWLKPMVKTCIAESDHSPVEII